MKANLRDKTDYDHLKSNERILKSILKCTGSQCRDFGQSVECELSFWSSSAHVQLNF